MRAQNSSLMLFLVLATLLSNCTATPRQTVETASTPTAAIETAPPAASATMPPATASPSATVTATPPATATPTPIAATSTPTATAGCIDIIPDFTKETIRSRVDEGANVGIVVGVVIPCGTEYYAYGAMTLSGDQAVDESTIFEIGSTGKAFTAILLADMVERGEVSMHDPIANYLPVSVTVPTGENRSITLFHLATHTAGLPSLPDNLSPADWSNPYADYTVEQMYEFLSGFILPQEPGAQYEYSNYGMGLLGHILALHNGTTYEELVVERIANELGMPDTRVTLASDMQQRLATGHRDGAPFINWDIPTLAGAGALLSSARDLTTFLAANMGLAESSLLAAMQATHKSRHGVGSGIYVGLGWHIRSQGGMKIIEHHGATGGYWTFLGFNPDAQVGAVILTNTFRDIDEIGIDLIASLARMMVSPTPGGPFPAPGRHGRVVEPALLHCNQLDPSRFWQALRTFFTRL